MARARRQFVPGCVYHVYSRGSNRQALFLSDADRLDFIACLARVVEAYELSCLGYCLMPNHYHALLQPAELDLSAAMKALNGRYSLRFNRRHGRDAHHFKNRFGAVLQETDAQFLWTVRYVARNPIGAGLCSRPEDWPWSSYRACAGLERPPAFLHVDRLLSFFSDLPSRAALQYRQFISDDLTDNGV